MSADKREKRHGLPVVKMSSKEGQRYEVDEEALASVLLRPSVRNLPVVVVSVAGAYRGGKSFLLDFFLRYLTAPLASQFSGEWLGREVESLEGFEWRGGAEANTKGIHLWPEPFIVSIPRTAEKVVVLLMDTQGTFDTESDMGDNSTIFALSTLLSSVQIYNLRATIGEDDLQHLQLFTEYGKLACDGQAKPFQTLNFLVRDWMNPYEYPHGYAGGEDLLKKKLAPKSSQKAQLREVREHIHSCFEHLQCFLMPHPGLLVADKNFNGCLCDIDPSFRTSLLELIPSLFDPANLTPKTINGERVQAQGLFEYFKQYVNVFNSDNLPEATTIFKATMVACTMSALQEARALYESEMDSHIVEDQSVSSSMMQAWHKESVAQAVDHFKHKKMLGPQDNNDVNLETLLKELEARLSLYLWCNDAKVRETIMVAKKAYEACVTSMCDVQARLCLHASDLAALHERAKHEALAVFNKGRALLSNEKDEERETLTLNLEELYKHLCTVNEQNNRSAILEARDLYITRMKDAISHKGVSSAFFMSQHERVHAEAIERFHSFRNSLTEESEDPDVKQLEQDIVEYFMELEKNNTNSNMWAMQVAAYMYNNHVSSAWGPQSCCFHPEALTELHNLAKQAALDQFLADRVVSEHDDYMDKLLHYLESRYLELQTNNAFNNKQAVQQALGEYTRLMDKHSRPALSSILIVPFIVKLLRLMWQHHDTARVAALKTFEAKRRGNTYEMDAYLTDLNKGIDRAFEDYKLPFNAFVQELGLQHLLPW